MLGFEPMETPLQTQERLFQFGQDSLSVFHYHELCSLVHRLKEQNKTQEEVNRQMTFYILDNSL